MIQFVGLVVGNIAGTHFVGYIGGEGQRVRDRHVHDSVCWTRCW